MDSALFFTGERDLHMLSIDSTRNPFAETRGSDATRRPVGLKAPAQLPPELRDESCDF